MTTFQEKFAESKVLFEKATAILTNDKATQEDRNQVEAIMTDAKRLKSEGLQLKEILDQVGSLPSQNKGGSRDGEDVDNRPPKFKSYGDQLTHIALAGNIQYRGKLHPGLVRFDDPKEGGLPQLDGKAKVGNTWEKDLGESVGASGGFLVAQEYRAEMMSVPAPVDNIRALATVIPMRSRQLIMPRLDQSGTTSGSPHFFGGIEASWTEEAQEKAQTDPTFGQMILTAYKLVCYTRASDELLADSAVGLVAFLSGPMGFAGAIKWEEEYTFLRGSGTGQPLGAIGAPGTLSQNRLSTATLKIEDIVGMVAKAYGDSLTWHMSRSMFSQLMLLNGPSAYPSYIFMPNGRDGAPASLLGFPINWSDKLPVFGTKGDVLLANWRFYVIGDRQATTIDSTNVERFRNDQTSWRAVHRVDGQPWLKAPLTYSDGVTQVSPFVVLDDKTT